MTPTLVYKTAALLFAITLFRLDSKAQKIASKPAAKPILLNISYSRGTREDTLQLNCTDDMLTELVDPAQKRFKNLKATLSNDGKFHFNIPGSPKGAYKVFLVRLKTQAERTDPTAIKMIAVDAEKIMTGYILRNGDQLDLSVISKGEFEKGRGYRHNFSLKFSGRGSFFQNLWHSVDSIAYHVNTSPILHTDRSYNIANYENTILESSLFYLKQFRTQLPDEEYYPLLAKSAFSAKNDEGKIITWSHYKQLKAANMEERKNFGKSYDSVFLSRIRLIPMKYLMESFDYLRAEYYRKSIQAILTGTPNFKDSLFTEISKERYVPLREKLFAQYFYDLADKYPGAIENLSKAIQLTKNEQYQAYLKSFKFAPGSHAYNFSLMDNHGKVVRLSDFMGKVVFMDFWFTGCVNCQVYYKNALSKAEEHFKDDPSVIFLAISIDKSKDMWLKSIKGGNYSSDNTVNLFTGGQGFNHAVIDAYGVHSYPRPVLISKDQKIVSSNITLRDEATLIREIELQKRN